MIDRVLSRKRNEVYAVIEYCQDERIDFHCLGRILENRFPPELLAFVEEYNGLVDDMVLSLLDEVEEKIEAYGLALEHSGSRVFNLCISNKTEISFFTKYPSGDGFKDAYPA